jgi:hypothetical protein
MARPIGSKSTLKGKSVLWAGDNYGWQSPGSYKKLEQQGKFKLGAQFLDRLGSYLGPAIQNIQGFQKEFRKATDKIPGMQAAERAVTGAMIQEDKLPSSVVARGGAVVAQRAGNALNIDPRIAGIGGLLIGGVHTSGPKKGTYKWKPTGDLKPHAELIEDSIESAHQHFVKHNSLDGHKNLIDLPDGRQIRISNKGGVNFERRVGLSPVAVAPKAGKAVAPSTPKPNVSTPVQTVENARAAAVQYGLTGDAVDRVLNQLPVKHILDPRYVAKIEQLVQQSTINWDKLKQYTEISPRSGVAKTVIRPGRSLNSLMGEPTPVMWDKLKDLNLENFDDLVRAYKDMDNVFSPMSSQEMFGRQYIEGHHPIQVESVAKASKHLPVLERLKFVNKLAIDYTYGGNEPRDMFGLSKPGHLGKMSGLPDGAHPMNAHQSILNEDLVKAGFTGREGDNWVRIDFTGYKDADSLAKAFWEQSGEPQIRFAEIVFDGPAESTIRQNLADRYGIRERDLYTPTNDKKRGENLKKLLTGPEVLNIIQDSYRQYYGP